MEDILLDTMFELPGMDTVEEVVVKDEAVNNGAKLRFWSTPRPRRKNLRRRKPPDAGPPPRARTF